MQPVVYAYDQEGRLVSMKSFRVAGQKIEDDPMTRQDGDETLWSYDEATSLLLSKTYPDLHQELYDYDTMNRFISKTQVRQVDDSGTPLITTYVYDELSGRLLQENHNDGMAFTQYSYDPYSGAINRFQRSLNKTIETSSLAIDGRIGPKVKKAFCELLYNHSESIINEFIDTFSKTTLSMKKNRSELDEGIRKKINDRASFSKSILISNNPAHDTI